MVSHSVRAQKMNPKYQSVLSDPLFTLNLHGVKGKFFSMSDIEEVSIASSNIVEENLNTELWALVQMAKTLKLSRAYVTIVYSCDTSIVSHSVTNIKNISREKAFKKGSKAKRVLIRKMEREIERVDAVAKDWIE